MKHIKLSLILLSNLLMFGCGSTPDKSPPQSAFYTQNTNEGIPIYGKLVTEGGTYRFSQFSTWHSPDEPWVRLNDGKPMWNLSTEKCGGIRSTGQKIEKVKPCRTESENLFREFETDIGRTALITAVSFGIGAMEPFGNVVFQLEKYEKAINQTGGIQQFKPLILGLTKLNDSLKQADTNMKQNHEVAKKRAVVTFDLTDNVGFFKNQVNLNDYVKLLSPSLPSPKLIKEASYSGFSDKINELYVKAIDERKNAESYLNIECRKKINSNGFEITLACPGSIKTSDNRFNVPITAIIESYEIANIEPSAIELEDKQLSLQLNDGRLFVTNKLEEYLSIESISYYYGDKITSIDSMDILLAPLSESNLLNMKSFKIDRRELSFKNVTKEFAENKMIRFGFAIRYKVAGEKDFRTLFQTRDYSLIGFITGN